MSYSFGVRGATKEEVAMKMADELSKVVEQQPVHEADCKQASEAASAFLNIVPPADDRDFYVSVSGSLGWNGTQGVDAVITNTSINVSVSLVAKE